MKKFLTTILFLAGLIYIVIIKAKEKFPEIDVLLLHSANIILAALTLLAYFLVLKGLKKEAPSAFIRGVFSGTLLKLFVLIVSLLTYVVLNKETLHKPSLFGVFGIYALYAIFEASTLSRTARKK